MYIGSVKYLVCCACRKTVTFTLYVFFFFFLTKKNSLACFERAAEQESGTRTYPVRIENPVVVCEMEGGEGQCASQKVDEERAAGRWGFGLNSLNVKVYALVGSRSNRKQKKREVQVGTHVQSLQRLAVERLNGQQAANESVRVLNRSTHETFDLIRHGAPPLPSQTRGVREARCPTTSAEWAGGEGCGHNNGNKRFHMILKDLHVQATCDHVLSSNLFSLCKFFQ